MKSRGGRKEFYCAEMKGNLFFTVSRKGNT